MAIKQPTGDLLPGGGGLRSPPAPPWTPAQRRGGYGLTAPQTRRADGPTIQVEDREGGGRMRPERTWAPRPKSRGAGRRENGPAGPRAPQTREEHEEAYSAGDRQEKAFLS